MRKSLTGGTLAGIGISENFLKYIMSIIQE